MDFKSLGLKEELCKALKAEKIITPNKVQEEIFKSIQEQKDIIVQSQTGTGKTLAYLLPLMNQMKPEIKGMQVLVLVPTHELAMQVHRQVERMSKGSGLDIKSAVIIGNVNINRQVEALRIKPQFVIGTPGRILELIKKRKITAHTIRTIVIDEADKLLDKYNIEDTKQVIKCCMRDVQKLFFSASIPQEALEQAKQIAPNSQICRLSDTLTIPDNIQHIYLIVERRDKIETLRKLAKSLHPDKAMVFINKLSDIEEATQKLQYHKYNAKCIHGTVKKQDRQQVTREFQNAKLQFLIATDIAARGLHFEGVTTVFHLSIPEDPRDYLHRAGRAGRGMKSGLSVSIITKEEELKIRSYQNALGIQMFKKKMYQGQVVRG